MIVDLFAGPGGWSEGLRLLGLADVGLEWEAAACATRAAAGHQTIRCDVEQYPLKRFAGAVGLIASPPCTDFSVAGLRAGIDGEAGRLMWQVPRWVEALRPEWVACEQVPPALDWWRLYAHQFETFGYSTWCGVVNAANYGVPQTRKRAILLASRVRTVAPPSATHEREPSGGMFGTLAPWVSMAEALGWSGRVGFPRLDDVGDSADGYRERDMRGTDEPAFNLTEKARSWKVTGWGTNQTDRTLDEASITVTGKARSWHFQRPATTIAGDPRVWPPGHKVNGDDRRRLGDDEANERYGDRAGTDAIKLTVADALVLQSFRPDYPVQGSRSAAFRQIGNAVPPRLAAHLLAAVVGLPAPDFETEAAA